jgi:response regulator RpfG family c-di-GMP phosphodiesterase
MEARPELRPEARREAGGEGRATGIAVAEDLGACAAPPAADVHVLVVDDEPQIRDILASVLRREGYRVTSRGNPREALEDFARAPVDLLLTDFQMPEMTGLELVEAAKRTAPGLGSVLVTAYATLEIALAALRQGVDDYLLKPFRIDEIRRVVERVLAARRLEGRGRDLLVGARDENAALRRQRFEAERALGEAKRDLRRSNRALERRVRDLEFTAELTDLLGSEDDLERTLLRTARIVARRFRAHVTRIEVDPGDGIVCAEHREGDAPVALHPSLGAHLLDRARSSGIGAVRDDALGAGGLLEALAAPVTLASGPAGGLVVLRPAIPQADADDLALLSTIPRAMRPAIEADRLRRRAASDAVAVAAAMLSAMEGRGWLRLGHADRVARLASGAGRRLGLSERAVRAVETAGRFHDLGEVAVPESILTRAGPLSEEEMAVVRSHAAVGARLLEGLGEAAFLVRHHHERPDGSGYPDGLSGSRVPIGAALVGAAEAWDAMTHLRPFRRARSPDEAADEMRKGRGTQFVREAADAVLAVVGA